MIFIDNLINKIKEKRSHCIVGIDTKIEYVPDFIKNKYEQDLEGNMAAILEFNKGIIDTVAPFVSCIKPQIAFYEAYGIEGFKVFKETVEYGKSKDLIIIADIKRGDIGSTAEAYANAYFGGGYVNVDAVTLNPYLGIDSIAPFIKYMDEREKGVFILARTSNKSAIDIQDIISNKKTIYEIVGEHIDRWGNECVGKYGYSSMGAVVGATYPKEMEKLRKIMSKSYFLVPGYGAQGGTGEDVVGAFNKDGLGAVVNSSRGIITAHKKEKYKGIYKDEECYKAILEETIQMRDNINRTLKKHGKLLW
ncbi:orotidine-5'-phosphate decarboxylase [Clostridiisalibacter paucivorans]|uniref:orotidine-5'-phosphate decarboxylase n=1 Tax=Clostridiisalibacter paucivorans TaxID=408753 RepID=UPI000A5FE534|nr:orotidine-5'-phosphate decarboxylase [Clostridiisalibacter paucivorans]